MIFKQRSCWYSYDFLLNILFLPCATISCVHPSLWIYTIMIVFYLESYTHERSYISRWYPFFHDHLVFLVFISLVAPWNRLSWVRILYHCILMHSFVVKIVFLMLVLTRLSPCQLVSLLLTMLSSIGIINWYLSLSSPWVVTSFVVYSLFSELVNPFACCVWEGRVLHLVSHLFKTMLMLNAHPYISLLRCFAMTHTHRFGWAYS